MAMGFLNDNKRKYLILIPVVFLLLNALFFQYAVKKINSAVLQEKYVEITDAVDMLAAAVEANPDRVWYEHERNICGSVEYLDSLYQIYCAAYKPVDGDLTLITERYYETSMFEPLDYPEFIEAIHTRESGGLVIGYTPDNQPHMDLHVYFRWTPLYSAASERYLIIAAVSQHSVVTEIPVWVSAGQWASMAVTFVLNVWLILLIVRMKNDAAGGGGGV